MADEPKKLNEITLEAEGLPESIREKFAGKSVADVIKSYEEVQKGFHTKSEELKAKEEALKIKEEEIEKLKHIPEPEPEPEEDDLFGDDTYVTKQIVNKTIEALEKKHEKNLQDVEERAVSKAIAQIEKKAFIDSHPEIFDGKQPQEADAIIKKIAGAGYVAGKQSLEGGLVAIREMAGELGLTQVEEHRTVPKELEYSLGEYETPDDEISHMVDVHKKTRGKISDTLR